ncbi:hypothetical protein [Agromyces sp. Marseille-Q5079]|uniref:hypothetical protein n=1 Tax=Agromyces sp. Marseille-Q5079 TaxID=3439059 RepID=UPI003D9CB498
MRWILLAILGSLLSVLVGAVIVRLGLDWADTFEYSAASEIRYLVVAGVALAVAIGGSAASAVFFLRRGRRARRER